MRRRTDWLARLVVVLAAGGAVWAGSRLFSARFRSPGNDPVFSSQRADAAGTRAFHDALILLPGISVSRNVTPLANRDFPGPATLFWLGADPDDGDLTLEAAAGGIPSLLARGGRLVVAFAVRGDTMHRRAPARKRAKPAGKRSSRPIKDALTGLEMRWGFSLTRASLRYKDPYSRGWNTASPVPGSPSGLPARLPCFTAAVFAEPKAPWNVVYRREGRPVVMTRPYGGGTLVLFADSVAFTNGALRRHHLGDLLAWAAGGNTEVIFEETHLGVRERSGVAAFLRKWRMHGLAGGLLLTALLWIWMQVVPFSAPVGAGGPAAEGGGGMDAGAGLVALLRRHLPARELVKACLAEWHRSAGRIRPGLAARLAAAGSKAAGPPASLAAAPAAGPSATGRPDAIREYRHVSGILNNPSRGGIK